MTSSPTHAYFDDASLLSSADSLDVSSLPNVHLDSSAAMEASYPCASKEEMDEFVKSLDEAVAAIPANLLLAAADKRRWSILHSLIKNGASMKFPNLSVVVEVNRDGLPRWNSRKVAGSYYESLFVVLCAFNGDFTVIRYVLDNYLQLQLPINTISLAVEQLFLHKSLIESMWLIENAHFSDDVFNAACLALIELTLYTNDRYKQDLIMSAMRKRGAQGTSLIGMYASLPNLLSMEFASELINETNTNFDLYPLVDMEVIRSFALCRFVEDRNDLATILLTAASRRDWDIVYTLLKMGISPLDTAAYKSFNPNGDSYDMAYCKSLPTCNADFLLISAVANNNHKMLRFLLSMQPQIGYSRSAIMSLPFVACRANYANVAVWLLETLDMNDLEYNESILRCIRSISSTSGFLKLAVILEMAATACRCLDLVAIVKSCFCSPVASYSEIQNFGFNSSILPTIIAAAAKLALPRFVNDSNCVIEDELEGYMNLFAYLQRFELSQLSATELGIQDAVKNNNIKLIDQCLESYKQELLFSKLVYRALRTAIKIQNFNIFKHVCDTNTASELVIYEYLTELLIAASIQDDCQFISFIFKAATIKFDSVFMDKLKAFVHHVIIESRVKDLLPLLNASILGSFADKVCQMVGLVLINYHTIIPLDKYLITIGKLMSPCALQSFVHCAMDHIYQYGVSPIYYEMLLNVARLDEEVFITALKHCLHLGATHNAEQIVSFVDGQDAWRTKEEKKSAYYTAIKIAGTLNQLYVTEYFTDFIYALPVNERLALPLSKDTWSYFLHGLSWRHLLEAQLASAESDTGTNYILVRHGLQDHKLAFEAKILSVEADQRHIAFKLSQLQHKYGNLTYSLGSMFNFIFEPDRLDYIRNADDCPICHRGNQYPPYRKYFKNDLFANLYASKFGISQCSKTDGVAALTAANETNSESCSSTHDGDTDTTKDNVPDISATSDGTGPDNDTRSDQISMDELANQVYDLLADIHEIDFNTACSNEESKNDSANTQIRVAQYLRLKYGYTNVSNQNLTTVSKELCRKYNLVHSPQCAGNCLTCSITNIKKTYYTLVTIPCSKRHTMHFDCFLEWFSQNSKCPECEEDIQSA